MSWFFEGSTFVIKDLRADFEEIRSPGYPFGWRGKGSRVWRAPAQHCVYHQTYGSISEGEEGPKRTARFLTGNPWFKCKKCGHIYEGSPKYPSTRCPKDASESQNLGRGRGFPSMSYTLFVPFRPKLSEGRAVIYLCVDFEERTWQAGSGNRGFGVGFQGRFRSRHNSHFKPLKGTNGQPSEAQMAVVEPLWREFIKPKFQWDNSRLSGHYMWGKAACPGDDIENVIRKIRGETPLNIHPVAPVLDDEKKHWFDSWEKRQAALVCLGYDLGDYGAMGNGVDGDPGEATRAALEGFQTDVGLHVDGIWGGQTEGAMRAAFEDNDLGYDDIKAQIPDGQAAPPSDTEDTKVEVPAKRPSRARRKKPKRS